MTIYLQIKTYAIKFHEANITQRHQADISTRTGQRRQSESEKVGEAFGEVDLQIQTQHGVLFSRVSLNMDTEPR